MEGFSSLILQKERDGFLHGIRICHAATCIHHLLFVDDSFIFANATVDEYFQLLDVPRVYEKASEQVVNLQKSSVVFSR